MRNNIKQVRSLSLVALTALAVAAGCSASPADGDASSTANAPPAGVEPGATPAGAEPTSEAEAAVTQGYVRTPSGIFHQDCIVELPDGASIDDDDDGFMTTADGTRVAFPACNHPNFRSARADLDTSVLDDAGDTLGAATNDPTPGEAPDEVDDETTVPSPSPDEGAGSDLKPDVPPRGETNGWVAASSWHSSRWLRKMTANMKVPKKPTSRGATVFLFPSLQPGRGGPSAILQPVLQYNWDHRNTWAIASWYVGPSRAVHSRPFDVKAGDSLAGTVSGSDCRRDGSHCNWKVTTKSRAQNRSGSITVRSNPIFHDFQGGALEVYNLDRCSQLPASDAFFTSLRVYDGKLGRLTPKFGNMYWNRICGVKVSHTTTSTTIKY